MMDLLLSTEIEQLITWAIYAVVVAFVLIQWFLSVRPLFIWGLVMPLAFAAFWWVALNPPGFLPEDVAAILTKGQVAYAALCKLGIIASLIIFVICRVVMLLHAQSRARAHKRRREEKRQRQMREAAALANSEPYNVAPQAKDPFGNVEL